MKSRSNRAKILIIGHGRHGKDTVAEFMQDHGGLSFVSSSEFAAEKAVFPLMADLYPDWRACFEDRANHRGLWHHAIAAYNLRPGPMLAEQILEAHDIYVGMRKRYEFARSRDLFDVVVWVDRSEHLPPEDTFSNELTADDADVVIDNNGDLEQLEANVLAFLSEQMPEFFAAADPVAQSETYVHWVHTARQRFFLGSDAFLGYEQLVSDVGQADLFCSDKPMSDERLGDWIDPALVLARGVSPKARFVVVDDLVFPE